MDFPQYRKFNGRVYYRIVNERTFDEVQIVGSRAILNQFKAEKYPELLRIKDMLEMNISGLDLSDKMEFEKIRKQHNV